MEETGNRPSSAAVVRVALVVFVLAWIFGPYALRSAVPILLVFLIALGLELNFLVSAFRSTPSPRPDRRPQVVERDRYGYDHETDDLVLIRRGDEEVWVAYSRRERRSDGGRLDLDPGSARFP